jgi:hypothetical protein
MPTAAELKALLLAKRETERIEQERRDAELAQELERLEEQEEEERRAKEAEERRVREEEERRVREEAERLREETERQKKQQETDEEELRLATTEDRQWLAGVLRSRNRGELAFRNNELVGRARSVVTGGSGAGDQDGDCWPCRVRQIECERRR